MFPAWTIPKADRDFEIDKTDSLGPGVYKVPDVEINHEEFPKWTIKGKYLQKQKAIEPGPGHYETPKFDSQGVAYTIQGKGGATPVDETLGPGYYNPRRPKCNKKMTIGEKHNNNWKIEQTPGPQEYNIPEVEVNHEEFPKWSIQGRQIKEQKSLGPGPGQYQLKEHKCSK